MEPVQQSAGHTDSGHANSRHLVSGQRHSGHPDSMHTNSGHVDLTRTETKPKDSTHTQHRHTDTGHARLGQGNSGQLQATSEATSWCEGECQLSNIVAAMWVY